MTRLAVRIPEDMREVSVEYLQKFLTSGGEKQPSITSESGFVPIPSSASLAEAENIIIDAALKRNNFNRKAAASQLGIGERTLRRKLNDK